MTEPAHVEALRRSRIAHELRGPAGVALGAAAELARKGGGNEAQFLGMMKRGLERVLRVADRLSRSSALERGIVSFNLSREDVRPLLTQELERCRELENRSSIELVSQIGAAPMLASFDHDWLAFCVGEVICNAIQHARKRVTLRLVEDDTRLVILAEDDGPGFRETPDFSFGAAPNPRRGVGLSLAIVHHVVHEGHRGSLTVGTGEQGGASVAIALPKTSKKEGR